MVGRYDGGISDVHCDVMYLKQIQRKPNVYMFRVLTKFSVTPIVCCITKTLCFHSHLSSLTISYEVSAILTDVVVFQLPDIPYNSRIEVTRSLKG